MIVAVPSYVHTFCKRFAEVTTKARRSTLSCLLAGILLARGKRTQSELARCVVSEGRAPSSVSRRMRRRSFGTRDLVRHMAECQIAEELARPDACSQPWFLLIAVVYSWKERTDSSGTPTGKHTFKVLVCSDPTIGGALIIEWFEIRWQVEVFFRELKSDLGLEDYRGSDFAACERHYDLTLLAFMLLEQYRVDAIAAERSPVRRRMLASSRTSKLRAMLERDARREDAAWFARERRSDDGREKIVELFPPLRRTGSGG